MVVLGLFILPGSSGIRVEKLSSHDSNGAARAVEKESACMTGLSYTRVTIQIHAYIVNTPKVHVSFSCLGAELPAHEGWNSNKPALLMADRRCAAGAQVARSFGSRLGATGYG